jgi:predicted Zn-dependent protease
MTQMKRCKAIPVVLAVCTALLLVISCAVNPVTGKRQLMLMSQEQELQLGLSYDPQVLASFGEYPDKNLQAYVQAKGTEMGKISHRPNVEYHIRVVDSPVVNAFAVPGGFVYLTRGILAQMNNEAELMGVMGHEIGHIAARHTASQQSKQTLGQLVLIGGMAVSQKFAHYAQYASEGMQLLFLSFSRKDESEADKLGVEYSSKVGYNAHRMADFFKVLKQMESASSQGGVPTFLSTHPDPGDRYNAVNQKATEWQTKLNMTDGKVNQDDYLKLIDGIVYGEDPRQGYSDGNVFYHPEMKFRFPYPSGWTLTNSPSQITIVPSDSKALILFTVSSQKTVDAAADTAIAQTGMKQQERKKRIVNGLPALVTLSKQSTQNQSTGTFQNNEIISYFINLDNTIYVFHGVATEADFNTYDQYFESTAGNFSRLTDASRLNVRPKRIHIVKVQRNGTLTDAFNYYNVPQKQFNELALLNDIDLTARVQAGKLIKIVGE